MVMVMVMVCVCVCMCVCMCVHVCVCDTAKMYRCNYQLHNLWDGNTIAIHHHVSQLLQQEIFSENGLIEACHIPPP